MLRIIMRGQLGIYAVDTDNGAEYNNERLS